MRLKDKRFHPWFLWGFLRSSEVRARLLSQSTGMNRHRIDWDLLRNLPVPGLCLNSPVCPKSKEVANPLPKKSAACLKSPLRVWSETGEGRSAGDMH